MLRLIHRYTCRFARAGRLAGILLVACLGMALAAPVEAQNGNGFIRFSGEILTSTEEGNIVRLGIGVFGATVPVVVDEFSTVSGSLGGRTSSRALSPGIHIEVEGWMRSDGSVRASEVEIKVQTGSIRMTGTIENILGSGDTQSILVNGIEFRLDAQTQVIVSRDGVAQAGSTEDLAVGTEVDIAGSELDQTGVGASTSTLFRADRIIAFRFFRLQGTIKSRIPELGTPTVLVIQGVAVTLTPETTIAGNGLNERNEAFLAREAAENSIVSRIEDDAGSPCGILNPTNAEIEQAPNCPDRAPSNPILAGDLQLGAAVRVEGVLEDTGFSTRYTARAIQVERMSSHIRFQGMVVSRSAEQLMIRINDGVTTPVVVDASTRFEGTVEAGRYVDVAAEMNADLSIRGRRIKEIP